MLLSSISSSMMSSSAMSSSMVSSSAAASSAISMMTTPGLPKYGAVVIIGLIALLSLKEIVSASEKWNKYLDISFNQAIIPLFLCFLGIVACRVSMII